ncbi:Nuclear hormone receptor FTZ-F1 beta [Schistosoma japonicum]|nr:Nuclear hormone receptor FTZ-F1 beta [Schistosoma japonicum]
MAASEVKSPADIQDDLKDESLKATVALDKLIMGVVPKSSGSVSTGNDSVPSTTYVTIHLPDGTQGSTLSQQKLQELIMHLSQSGQIQLREDSKIVIDLKFTGKSADQAVQPKLENSSLQHSAISSTTSQIQTIASSNPHRVLHIGSPGSDGVQIVRTIPSFANSNTQIISFPAVATQQPVASQSNNPRQQIQQQPTYILVPAAQLASGGENQVFASTPIRAVTAGHTMLRTSGLAINNSQTANANSVNLGSTDRSIILVQQPVTGAGIHVGSTNTIVSGSASVGGTTLVPLRQLNVSGGGNGLVSNAGSTRLLGSNVGVDLFSNTGTVGSRSSQGQGGSVGLVAISANAGASGSSSSGTPQRESTWQQYVKQFTKLGPCPICGDKISGYHYGIFCCESCKGFFKRTVQNAKRYACHRPNASSRCEINVASRKKCPACRFLKCVDKGMRIEAIRSDRTRGGRSMYPGSRYLRQIAARVSGARSNSGLGISSSSIEFSTSDIDGNMLGGLTDQSMMSDDADQLSCSVVGLAAHTLGPDGLPASEDAGGGVYLDPGVLGTHDNDDEEIDSSRLRVEPNILECEGGIVGGTNISTNVSPYLGRQVIIGGSSESTPRSREQLPKIIRDILLVEETIEAEPEDALEIDAAVTSETAAPEGVSDDEAAVYRALLNLADQRLYRTVRWSRALPDFSLLDTDDQILLIQNCWADLLCLDCCWRSLPTPSEIRLTSSQCINLEAAREMGAEEIVERILQLTQSLTRLQLDVVEYACLKVIVLMQPDLSNLKANSRVRSYHESVRRLLMEYVAKSSPDINDKFNKLINRIPELRKTSQAARLMLVDLDLSSYLSTNSLLMELLRSDIQRYTPNNGTSNLTESTTTSVQGSANSYVKTVSVTLGSNSVEDPEGESTVTIVPSSGVTDLLSLPNHTTITTVTESRLNEAVTSNNNNNSLNTSDIDAISK